jgi:hypothetical protein
MRGEIKGGNPVDRTFQHVLSLGGFELFISITPTLESEYINESWKLSSLEKHCESFFLIY